MAMKHRSMKKPMAMKRGGAAKKKKSLLETNPYLKDPAGREARIVLNVATSSAIEGVSPSAFNSPVTTGKNQTGRSSSKIFSIGA